ncbi:MAG: efflux RND transporter periplasmic adaptor subunit [Bacteroidia bacterium]|nr:efflux RND transporter periplasmic adaptor subunit [Bacteroidia bacterium]
MNIRKYIIIACLNAGFVAGCGSGNENRTPPKQGPDVLMLSPQQVQNAGISSGPADSVEINSEVLLNGMVEAPPSHKISISFPVGAVVKNIGVLPGQKVQKGQLLCRLESMQIAEIQRAYLSSEALCLQLEAEAARQEEMARSNASSEKQLQEARTRLLVEKAAREALKQQLALLGVRSNGLQAANIRSYVDITAPAAGYISEVSVNEGMYTDAGREILVMIDPADMHISLQAFENHLPLLREDQQVQFFTNSSPEQTFSGRIIGIGRQIGADRSFTVHCHTDDPALLLVPGMFVNGKVQVQSGRVHALPLAAIVRNGDKAFAFTDEGGGRFQEHLVKTGLSDETHTQVILPATLSGRKWVKTNAYTLWLSLHNAAAD